MKFKSYLYTTLILITFVTNASATGQIADILIHKGDTLLAYSNPLEQLPDIQNLRAKLFGDKEGCLTTDCWRGYQAEWTIIDDQLFLTAIYSCCYKNDKIKADLKQLFGEKFRSGKVKADWVTGEILSPQGQQLYYVHSGYQSLYEREAVFDIVKGEVKRITTFDNSRSKKSIYSEASALQNFVYSNIRWETLPKQDEMLSVLVHFSANEQGTIDSIRIVRGLNEVFDKEIARVLKSIPEWDVFYRRGQHERNASTFQFIFSEEIRRKYKNN